LQEAHSLFNFFSRKLSYFEKFKDMAERQDRSKYKKAYALCLLHQKCTNKHSHYIKQNFFDKNNSEANEPQRYFYQHIAYS
jgi:hypothetical protein